MLLAENDRLYEIRGKCHGTARARILLIQDQNDLHHDGHLCSIQYPGKKKRLIEISVNCVS